jgi:hypothetical protein
MDAEVVKAFKQQQELINEVVKKLDDYFLALHNENSEAIDDLTITLLGGEEESTNV